MELSNCVTCDNSDIAFRNERMSRGITGIAKVPFKLFECRSCRTVFINPRPTKNFLENIYSKSGHSLLEPISLEKVNQMEEEYPNGSVDGKRMVAVAYELLQGQIENNERKLKALDIGSGYGFFSVAAINSGFDVTAINPSVWENDIYEQINGFRPIQKFFEDVTFSDRFDLVILSQVLEHIDNPLALLKRIRNIMNPKGILIVAVPNLDSYLVKAGKDGGVFWIPEHLTCFSKKGLVLLLQRAGFKVQKATCFSRFPYFAVSNKFGLKGTPRRLCNFLVKVLQVIPLRIFDQIGWGGTLNAWVSPDNRSH